MSPSYYLPNSVRRKDIYHDNWIDFNKNGVKDPYEDPNLPVDKRVEDLLSRMTIEEKVIQLRSSFNPEHIVGNLSCVLRKCSPKEGAIRANEIQRKYIEETRLGIPAIIHDECLHGCVAKFSTSFPQAIALAATWDPDLVYRVAKAIAKETRARGINQCLSPVVNIIRDVRAGRTEESFGEDPYLISIMTYMYCKAFREEGIIATPKHYIMNFVGDGGRDSHEIHLSERIIRETELPAYIAAIKAGALSVMAAYNSIDGIPCSCNKWLLTEVLRWELGFEGFVVSDYGSVGGIIWKHRVTDKPEEAAKLALEAGLDVELPETNIYGDPLIKAVKEGLIDEEVLNEAVRRVLKAKFLIGLFDRPYVDPDEAEAICNSKVHKELALEAARKAVVLLKNENNILPLDKNKIKSIAVLGPLSDEVRLGGYSGIPKEAVSPLDGIRRKVEGTNIIVNHAKGCPLDIDINLPIPIHYLSPPDQPEKHGLRGEYFDNPDLKGDPVGVRIDAPWEGFMRFDWGYDPPHPGLPRDRYSVRWTGKIMPPETGTYEFKIISSGGGVRLWIDEKLLIDSWDSPADIPRSATIKLEAGRQYDIRVEYRKIGGGYAYIKLGWDIVGVTEEMRKAIELAKKSDVAIIFVGIVEGEQRDRALLRLPRLQEKLIEEVLKVNKNTIVVLITGSAVTGEWIYHVPAILQAWYPGQEGGIAIADVLFGDYNPAGRLPFTWPRHEGQLPLYYNYKPSGRVYDYVNMPSTPLFPFGHGLSYTKFKYDNLRIDVNEKNWIIRISVDVENVGEREGDEVVQLYIRDKISSIARPLKELRGFKRITLKPGERKTVTFTLTPDDLAMFDENMRRVVEPGAFEVMIGASSEDIRLIGEFYVKDYIKGKSKLSLDVSGQLEVKKGETIEIPVRIKNEGLVSDLIPITLYVDSREVERHKIYLEPNEERRVKFRVTLVEEGIRNITIATPESISTIVVNVVR